LGTFLTKLCAGSNEPFTPGSLVSRPSSRPSVLGDDFVAPPQTKEIFHTAPESLECIDDGYNAKIPRIMVHLKIKLFELDAPNVHGIFRKAADRREMQKIKSLMVSDTDWRPFLVDVHCCATLITTWFRDLPSPILQQIPMDLIKTAQSTEDVPTVVKAIPEPKQSLLLFIWDISVLISDKADLNEMTVENLATIMVPSLYDCSSLTDPLQAMTILNALQEFFAHGVRWRQTVIDRDAFVFEQKDDDSSENATNVNNPSNDAESFNGGPSNTSQSNGADTNSSIFHLYCSGPYDTNDGLHKLKHAHGMQQNACFRFETFTPQTAGAPSKEDYYEKQLAIGGGAFEHDPSDPIIPNINSEDSISSNISSIPRRLSSAGIPFH